MARCFPGFDAFMRPIGDGSARRGVSDRGWEEGAKAYQGSPAGYGSVMSTFEHSLPERGRNGEVGRTGDSDETARDLEPDDQAMLDRLRRTKADPDEATGEDAHSGVDTTRGH